MMGTEDKTLLCYCRWGWKEKVLPDGSISYVGGITRQVTVKTGIKYNDFVSAVFNRLGIVDPSDKILQFTAKFHKSRLIDLRDQKDVNALLQFNDGFADVYASSLDKEPYSRPTSGKAVVSDSKPDAATHVRDDENELASRLKKARCIQSAGGSVERLNQNGAGLREGDMQSNSSKIGIFKEQASKVASGGGKVIVISDSEPDTTRDTNHPVNEQAYIPPSVGTHYVTLKELHMFSQRIPPFKMTGTREQKGVPAGSFELNPYAHPHNPNDIWHPGKFMEDRRTGNFKPVENVSPAVPPGSRGMSRTSEHATTSQNTGNMNGVRAANRDFPMLIDLDLKLWPGGTKE